MNITLRVLNYITRYAPSEKKVRGYLAKKKCQNIEEILQEIGYNESLMCDMWMRTFITTAKGKRDIIQKLTKKEFPKELILEKIEKNESEIMNWDEYERQIVHQRDTYLGRGKSKQFIMMTLASKYPYFRDNIREIVEAWDDASWLQKEVEKYRAKYNLSDPKEKQKFYSALLRKGFTYDEVKKVVKNVFEI